MNAFGIPIALILPGKIHAPSERGWYFFLIFPLLGLVLLIRAVHATLQFRKFGGATLRLVSHDGAIGGTLSGMIFTRKRVRDAKSFRVLLRYIERVSVGSGKERHVEERVLWEDWRNVRELDGADSGIPVLFEVPAHCPPANPARGISWTLEAAADVPGIDSCTSFELPMTCSASPRSTQPKAAQFEQQSGAPVDMAALLGRRGVRVRLAGGGVEMRFAAGRNAGTALTITVLFAAFLALLGWKFKPAFSFDNIFVGGILLVLAIFFGSLFAILWGVSSRIHTDGAALHLTKCWFGVPVRLTVDREKIEGIDSEFGMSAGYTTYYNLLLLTNAGKKVTLAHNVRGQRETRWLVEELRRALRLR